MSDSDKFSLDNFKRWMKGHNEEHTLDKPKSGLVGTFVTSKVGVRKLVDKMVTEGSNLEEIAIDFRESGGKIVEVDGKNLVIEVATGLFTINRYYIRRG
jgi:hypothetical protein